MAIDPRPDPEDLYHAPTSQVPRIHDSCHSGARTLGPDEDFTHQRSTTIPKSTLDNQSTLDYRPLRDIQQRPEPSSWMSAITAQINAL